MTTVYESWTPAERRKAWTLYVQSDPDNKSIWQEIAIVINKSIQAVRTEIWKIHRCKIIPKVVKENGMDIIKEHKETYWDRAGRNEVFFEGGREGLDWSLRDLEILMNASDDGLEPHRIGELLGRKTTSICSKIKELKNAGRKPLFKELE